MKSLLKHLLLGITALSTLLLGGCGGSSSSTDQPLKVGVTPGPHAEIMDEVKKVAEKEGLKLEIIEFSDYVQPNAALADGEIDINSYQHQPFLENMVKDRGYNLVTAAKTIIFPIGIYSKKVTNLSDVPDGASIAIPNDPTNGGRALALLAQNGLLTLKDNTDSQATVADIVSNPKQLKIIETDAAQIPRSLEDVSIAAINCNYAMSAGLVPSKDALALESSNSPYANILAVREDHLNDPRIQQFIKIYHSDEIRQFVNEHFAGSAFPAW